MASAAANPNGNACWQSIDAGEHEGGPAKLGHAGGEILSRAVIQAALGSWKPEECGPPTGDVFECSQPSIWTTVAMLSLDF